MAVHPWRRSSVGAPSGPGASLAVQIALVKVVDSVDGVVAIVHIWVVVRQDVDLERPQPDEMTTR